MTDQELIDRLRGGDMDVLLDAADRLAAKERLYQIQKANAIKLCGVLSENDKETERLRGIVEAYAASARSIALQLDAYCDRSLPYDKMILDAAQKAVVALSRVEAERDAAKRTLDGICGQIDNDCWLRKQFCENGDGDLEPCPCPSLREHDGYIDSDDCEGCECFVNSWRGAQGEE